MKRIKDLREQYDLITEKDEHDMNKLTQLVRAGLFDAKKLSALKRAMEKPADKMTAQEKRMMINLLDSLMAEVLSDKQVYRKVKQDVMKEAASWKSNDYFSADPRPGQKWPDPKKIPSVLLIKRKAIRVFPDGQKVALYYAQGIDKYISIPFSEIGINEGKTSEFINRIASSFANTSSDSADSSSGAKPKELSAYVPSYKAKISNAKVSTDDEEGTSKAVSSRMRQKYYKSLQNESVSDKFRRRLDEAGGSGAVTKWMQKHPDQGKTLGNAALDVIPYTDALKKVTQGDYTGAAKSAAIDTAVAWAGGKVLGAAAKGLSKGYKMARGAYDTYKAAKAAKVADDFIKLSKTIPDKTVAGAAEKAAAGSGKALPAPEAPATPKVEVPKQPTAAASSTPKAPKIEPQQTAASAKTASAPTKVKDAAPEFKMAEPATSKGEVAVRPTTDVKVPEPKPTEVKVTQPKASEKLDAKATADVTTDTKLEPADKKVKVKTKGRKAKLAAGGAGLAGFIGALSSGSSDSDTSGKPLNPYAPKFTPKIANPSYHDVDAARKSKERSAYMKSLQEVNLGGNIFELNSRVAPKVKKLYESLNAKNKKKMVKLMNESDEELNKIITFATRQ